MTSIVTYPGGESAINTLPLVPSIAAFLHELVGGGEAIFGFLYSDLQRIYRSPVYPHPRIIAAQIIAKQLLEAFNDGDIDERDLLDGLNRLDSFVYDLKLSPAQTFYTLFVSKALGFRVLAFIHAEPVVKINRLLISGRAKDALSPNVLPRVYDAINKVRRKNALKREFERLSEVVLDFIEPKFEDPSMEDPRELRVKVDRVLFSLHDKHSPIESFKAPFIFAKSEMVKRFSLMLEKHKELNPLIAFSTFSLFRRWSYASFTFFKTLIQLELPIGYDPAFGEALEENTRISELAKPGLLYGVLGDAFAQDLYEVFLDQQNDQVFLPGVIHDGLTLFVHPNVYGSEGIYLEALTDRSKYEIIREIIQKGEERDVYNNHFFGILVNSSSATAVGRYLGQGRVLSKPLLSRGRPKEFIIGKYVRRKDCVSLSFIPGEEANIYASLAHDVVFYVSSEKPPENIDVDECIYFGHTAVYFEEGGKLKGRCVERFFNTIDREPFLL